MSEHLQQTTLAGEQSTAGENNAVPGQEELPGQSDSFEISRVRPLLERVLRDVVRNLKEGKPYCLRWGIGACHLLSTHSALLRRHYDAFRSETM